MQHSLSPLALQKRAELEASAADARVVAELSRVMVEGTDLEGYKINAFRLADALGVPRPNAVRALVFASKLGLFDLNWDVHCPSCKGIPEYSKHLMQLRERSHCGLCDVGWAVDFADQVEVTFTLNPEVRPIAYQDFAARDFGGQMQWFREVGGREGRYPVRGTEGGFKAGERRVLTADFAPGEYDVYVHSFPASGATLVVRPGGSTERQEIHAEADGSLREKRIVVAPGVRELDVHFGYPKNWGIAFFPSGWLANWVSAAYVTSLQDFRDLFSGEFLSPDVSFGVRSVTLLFTDIKGSTEMYEALGDAAAYKRVQDHFRLMTEIIRRHDGGIIKTIGDAVMASFPVNLEGVKAAVEILAEFRANAKELGGIEVKVGLHRGAAIAVTSNRLLDYFGRTVNVAARVQGQSQASELLLSPAVVADEAVERYLKERAVVQGTRRARLKGVEGEIELRSVRLG
jgi:adenylate cyclase